MTTLAQQWLAAEAATRQRAENRTEAQERFDRQAMNGTPV